jgi:hypothetical protein
MDDFNEVGVGAEDRTQVREEIRPIEGKVGDEVGAVGIVDRGVGVRRPKVEAAEFHFGNVVGVVLRVRVEGGQTKEGLTIFQPVGGGDLSHTRDAGGGSWV